MRTLLLALALACTCTDPPSVAVPAAKTKAKARPPRARLQPPIGVPGPARGELVLTAEAPPAGGAPVPPQPVTRAKLALTLADGTAVEVELGQTTGSCAERPVAPVGPENERVLPLWTAACVDPTGETLVHVAQQASWLVVARQQGTRLRVVLRVPLVEGLVVERATPAPEPP